jgi:hypothetical protein
MYTHTNFPTKKALKEAVESGQRVTCFEPGLGAPCIDGVGDLEGPHYPKAHSWYASCVIKDGVILRGTVK